MKSWEIKYCYPNDTATYVRIVNADTLELALRVFRSRGASSDHILSIKLYGHVVAKADAR